MRPSFFRVGIELRLLDDLGDELVLEGRSRLQPGRVVNVAPYGQDARRLLVTEWRLIGVGSNGPVYRGRGRLLEIAREPPTPIPPTDAQSR